MTRVDETPKSRSNSARRWLSTPLVVVLALAPLHIMGCGQSGGDTSSGGNLTPGTGENDPPEDLAYPQRVFTLTIGETLETQIPTVTGTVTQYSLTGTLPSGLSFDSATGAISGTPSELTADSPVEVTASNSVGTDTISLIFRVPETSNYAFSINASTGSIASFALDRSCGSLVQAGSIIASSTTLSSPEVDPAGRFLCVADLLQLKSFTIDGDTGLLTLASTVDINLGPHDISLHSSGDYIYVTTRLEDRLRVFGIDAATGVIDPTPVADLTTLIAPSRLIQDPLGRYLLVEHEFENTPGSERTRLLGYTMSATGDVLTESFTSNLVLVDPIEITLDPLGEHFYMTTSTPNEFVNWVIHYSVDPLLGKVVLVDLEKAGVGPTAMAVSPQGRFMYVTNEGSENISKMVINASTGGLTKLTNLDSTEGTNALSMSSDGSELYAVDPALQTITVQTIDDDNGQFVSSEVFATGASASELSILSRGGASLARGTNLYLALEDSGELENYRIDRETGTLALSGTPQTPGLIPTGLAIDPEGRFVFASVKSPQEGVGSNLIVVYEVLCDGTLNELNTTQDLLAGEPGLMVVDPSGTQLFIAVGLFDLLMSYSIDDNGNLAVVGSKPLGPDLVAMEVDPSGSFLSLAHRGTSEEDPDRIVMHAIDPKTGALSDGVTSELSSHPVGMTFNADGTRIYVTQKDEDTSTIDLVQPFSVALDGSLTAIGSGAITQPEPRDIRLTPDGMFAFVSFEVSDFSAGGLLVYHVDPSTGELSNGNNLPQWRNAEASGMGPSEVEISPDGTKLYVLARVSEEMWVFDIEPTNGIATLLGTQPVGPTPTFLGLRIANE